MRSDRVLPHHTREEAFVFLQRFYDLNFSQDSENSKRFDSETDEKTLDSALDRMIEKGSFALFQSDGAGAAYACMDAALSLRPKTEAYFARSTAEYMLGFPEESLNDINVFLGRLPRDPCAHALRGADLHALGRLSEALEAFDHALELDDSNFLARLGRAECLLDTGHAEAALTELDKLSHFTDLSSFYWILRERAYVATGRPADAQACEKRDANEGVARTR